MMIYSYVNYAIPNSRTLLYTTYKGGDELSRKSMLFRIDYRLSYQRILSNRFAIGIEYAYEKIRLNSNSIKYNDPVNNIYNEKYSSPIYSANSFLITFEFFQKNSIAGQGFSFAFGIGPKLYRFNDKVDYRNEYLQKIPKEGLPSSKLNHIGINAFYQMTYRHPINKLLSFEVGLRFHTGYVLRKNFNRTQVASKNYYYRESTMYNQLYRRNLFNLASLKTGFVISL